MDSPLNETHRRDINKQLAELNGLLQEIEKAERAGVDMTEARMRRDHIYQYLTAIKAEYFPNKP